MFLKNLSICNWKLCLSVLLWISQHEWTPEIFLECYCDQGGNQSDVDLKTKPQAAKVIFLWFLGVLALILAVIGDNTVNIPEIF